MSSERPNVKVLAERVTALSVRFEALLDDLVASKAITAERQQVLLGDTWQSLLPAERVDIIRSRWRQAMSVFTPTTPPSTRPTRNWRRNVGTFINDPAAQEVFDDVLRNIESDRSP